MKVYKYIHCRKSHYDEKWFEDRGIVFAPNEEIARKRVMEEHFFEGSIIMLKETHVISLEKI